MRNIEQTNMIFFGDPRLPAVTQTYPINVMFLTSVRDVGTCDRNGTYVETGNGVKYMEGAIERIIAETLPSGRLAGLVNIVGIITDDMNKDMRDSSYAVLPESGMDWIYPTNLSLSDGRLVSDITENIPSNFRGLGLAEKAGRRQLKYEFEAAIFQRIRELSVDILISDHYMARLDHLHGKPSLFGRILNIHPAVTLRDHPLCLRGKTPTADAIERANLHGMTRTGATLHFINAVIDDGPPIAYIANTPVYLTDEPQWLRHRNYSGAKLPLFVEGLAHYARSIYPYLDRLNDADLARFQPVISENTLNGRAQHENILLR